METTSTSLTPSKRPPSNCEDEDNENDDPLTSPVVTAANSTGENAGRITRNTSKRVRIMLTNQQQQLPVDENMKDVNVGATIAETKAMQVDDLQPGHCEDNQPNDQQPRHTTSKYALYPRISSFHLKTPPTVLSIIGSNESVSSAKLALPPGTLSVVKASAINNNSRQQDPTNDVFMSLLNRDEASASLVAPSISDSTTTANGDSLSFIPRVATHKLEETDDDSFTLFQNHNAPWSNDNKQAPWWESRTKLVVTLVICCLSLPFVWHHSINDTNEIADPSTMYKSELMIIPSRKDKDDVQVVDVTTENTVDNGGKQGTVVVFDVYNEKSTSTNKSDVTIDDQFVVAHGKYVQYGAFEENEEMIETGFVSLIEDVSSVNTKDSKALTSLTEWSSPSIPERGVEIEDILDLDDTGTDSMVIRQTIRQIEAVCVYFRHTMNGIVVKAHLGPFIKLMVGWHTFQGKVLYVKEREKGYFPQLEMAYCKLPSLHDIFKNPTDDFKRDEEVDYNDTESTLRQSSHLPVWGRRRIV